MQILEILKNQTVNPDHKQCLEIYSTLTGRRSRRPARAGWLRDEPVDWWPGTVFGHRFQSVAEPVAGDEITTEIHRRPIAAQMRPHSPLP